MQSLNLAQDPCEDFYEVSERFDVILEVLNVQIIDRLDELYDCILTLIILSMHTVHLRKLGETKADHRRPEQHNRIRTTSKRPEPEDQEWVWAFSSDTWCKWLGASDLPQLWSLSYFWIAESHLFSNLRFWTSEYPQNLLFYVRNSCNAIVEGISTARSLLEYMDYWHQ